MRDMRLAVTIILGACLFTSACDDDRTTADASAFDAPADRSMDAATPDTDSASVPGDAGDHPVAEPDASTDAGPIDAPAADAPRCAGHGSWTRVAPLRPAAWHPYALWARRTANSRQACERGWELARPRGGPVQKEDQQYARAESGEPLVLHGCDVTAVHLLGSGPSLGWRRDRAMRSSKASTECGWP